MTKKYILFGLTIFLISNIGFTQNKQELVRSSDKSEDIRSTPIFSKNRKVNVSTKNKVSSRSNSSKSITSSEAGTTVADFSVSLSGGAAYNIPFATPPGIKDINPNIGLSYNSQSSNGLAGWGWNISGLSTITRIGSSIFHDGQVDGVDFDELDRFSLDGQRLIVKNGTYGEVNAEYQTETYSNIKIKSYGTSPYGASYGPKYFVVFYPDGSRAWYGNAGNSRNRLEWAIYKKQDPQGNFIQYSYNYTNNLLSIDKIVFGSRTGTTSPIELKFYYKDRKRPELAFVNSNLFNRTNILDRVEVKGNGQLYRKYQLTHDETSLGYERIISVQEFNSLGNGLTPINFQYENSSSNGNEIVDDISGLVYPGYNYQTDNILSGEFNGDGKLDFILYNKDTRNQLHVFDNIYEQSYNNIEIGRTYNVSNFDEVIGNSMLNHQGKKLSQQGITMIKENVSGYSSSVQFKSYYHGATGLYYNYTKTWNAPTYNYESNCYSSTRKKIPKEYISGDFNGDGLTDVLAIGKPYTNRYCYEYDCPDGGGGFDPIQRITQQKDESDEDFKIRKEKHSSSNQENMRPDPDDEGICCSCNTYTTNYRTAYFIDLNRNLTSNFVSYSGNLQEEIEDDDKIYTGDFNGDGKTDLFHVKKGEIFIYELDSDKRLVLIHSESDSHIKLNRPTLLGDYNGDGKTDILIPTSSGSSTWKFFLSLGNSTTEYTKSLGFKYLKDEEWVYLDSEVYLYSYRYMPYDYNGDGKTDILINYSRTPLTGGNNPMERMLSYVNTFNENETTPSFNSLSGYIVDYNGDNISPNSFPIFLDTNHSNGNLELALINANRLRSFSFPKEHSIDMSLKKINNNGIIHEIDYSPLNTQNDEDYENVYSGFFDELYPYVNVNIAPTLKLVKEVREIGAGMTRTQNFKYRSAVSHAHGLGFIGFKQFKKSNWHGSGIQTVWSISNHDPQKRGAMYQQWTSFSSMDTPNNYFNKTDYTYNTQITGDNVYISNPAQIVAEDILSGITKTKSFGYDQYYNPLSITTSFTGGSETINYQYSNNITSNNQWYHVGRITDKTAINVLGSETFSSTEKYFYNNNLITHLQNKGNNTNWVHEYNLHDAFGNVTQKKLSATGIADRIELFEYYTSGRFLKKKTDIEGLITNYDIEASTGNPISTTDPFGLITQYEYDGWQRLIKKTNYLDKKTYYSYQNNSTFGTGGLLKTTNYDQGQDEKTYYNAFGWVERKAVLSLNNKWIQKDIDYDIAGRKIKESQPYFSTASASQWDRFYFDQYSRPNSTQLHTGRVINTTYNGLTVSVDDGVKTTTKTSDALGNIITHQDPGGTINYTYYANGVMKSADYDSHIVSTTIDGWGRKTSLNDPSAGNYTYSYNIIGELLEETTPKGATTYQYDDFGKITHKEVIGDKTDLIIDYSYNPTSKLLASIIGVDNENNRSYEYTYEYDAYKRLIKTNEDTDFTAFQKEVVYDGYGRIQTEEYTANSINTGVSSLVKTKNIYDSAGILKELRDASNNNPLWKVNSENARGQVLNTKLGNNFIKTRQYDQYGSLSMINDLKLESSVSTSALKMDYTFNAQRGTLITRKNYAFNNWQETFAYDDLDRLTEISGSVNHSQSYDERGRISNNSFVGDYNYDSVSTYRASEIDLNNQGDLYYQNHSLQQIIYNAFKKPVEIFEEEKGRVSLEYGPMMNRTTAYYGGLQEDKMLRNYHKHYSSIIPSEIVENTEDGSTKIIIYIGGDAYTAPIAHIKTESLNVENDIDEFHYLHRDYLGSILAITNSSGEIKEQSQFGAWGLVDKFINSEGETSFSHDSLLGRGFTGHEHFFEVSLIHMNGRMYDANLGRFLSPDNFIHDPYNTQAFNRYSYVWNNPLSFNDPSGEEPITIATLLIYAAIGVTINGVINTINGQGFFEGAGLAAFFAVATFGVGEAVSGMTGLMKVAVQTYSHGVLGMGQSGMSGGSAKAGFLSGAFGSIMSFGAGHALKGAKQFWRNAGMITAGGLSGGVGSRLAGGNFWEGVRNGLISSTLNHVAHSIQQKISINSMFKKAIIDPKSIPEFTDEYLMKLVEKIPYLKEVFLKGGSPEIKWTDDDSSVGEYFTASKTVYISKFWNQTNYQAVSTMFHEFFHAYQHVSGIYNYAIENWGPLSTYSKSRSYLEMGAYQFQLQLGDQSAIYGYNKYLKRFRY